MLFQSVIGCDGNRAGAIFKSSLLVGAAPPRLLWWLIISNPKNEIFVFSRTQSEATDSPVCVFTKTSRYYELPSVVSLWSRKAPKVRGAGTISVIFGSQVPLLVHYCERDEVCLTTLLWQNNGRQNGILLRMLFSEYYIVMNKVTFLGFSGGDRPNRSPCGLW